MSEHGIFRVMDDATYRQWIDKFDAVTPEDTELLGEKLKSARFSPRMGVAPVAVGRPDPRSLDAFAARLNGAPRHCPRNIE